MLKTSVNEKWMGSLISRIIAIFTLGQKKTTSEQAPMGLLTGVMAQTNHWMDRNTKGTMSSSEE